MKVSIYVKSREPFQGIAEWSGPSPWPALPAVGETVFCCSEMDLGSVAYRQFTWDEGDVEIVIHHDGPKATYQQDFSDLRTHLRDDHGWGIS